jgi:hypothetical protein
VRRSASALACGAVAGVAVLLLGSASAQLGGRSTADPATQQVTLLAGGPVPPAAPAPAPREPANLDVLAQQATAKAQRNGADISIAVLDRQSGQLVTKGDGSAFPIASVAKLFIADDLLLRVAEGKATLTAQDRRSLDTMLRASDDFAANEFWERGGRNAVIARVTERYGLRNTSAPWDGNWWTTMSSTTDLVRYYRKLLDGSGGLPAQQAGVIMADLAASAPVGVDGYPQRFGIPDGLYAEPVAVKQGWMCCWDGPNQVHMSTGVAGADRRYVIAVASMQPVDEATARNTLTDAVKTMFPGGRT